MVALAGGLEIGYPDGLSPDDRMDNLFAFHFIRGMLTIALADDGWDALDEGSGWDWAHWTKPGGLIAIRGWQSGEGLIHVHGGSDEDPDDFWVALADRMRKASGVMVNVL